MRVLYFNDQTEEFYDTPKDIYLLGSLYLKGKPYTNPKEAVDKEYVDNAFDNITSDNITEKVPASAYPAFGGDLTNKAKTNNFTLKAVGKAGRYHKPTFDSAGRITGGKTGKLTLNKNDISGIDFGKIQFLPKEDWDSITDWTKGFDRTKYLMLDDKTINFKNPVAINEKKIINENMVINEDQVMEVSEEFFTGQLGGLKRDGIFDLEVDVDNIYDYNMTNSTPWLYQANFTEGVDNPVDISSLKEYSLDWGISNTTTQLFVSGGHSYMIFFEDLIRVYRILFNDTIERELVKTFDFDPVEKGVTFDTVVTNFFIFGNKYILSFRINITATGRLDWVNLTGDVLDDGILGDSVESSSPIFLGASFLYNKMYYLHNGSAGSGIYDLYPDLKYGPRVNLPGEVNKYRIGNFNSGRVLVNLGPFIYLFFTSRMGGSQEITINKVSKISTYNGIPFGEWVDQDLETGFPAGTSAFFVLKGKICILTYNHYVEFGSTRYDLSITYIDYDKKGNLGKIKSELLVKGFRKSITQIALMKDKLLIIYPSGITVFDFKGSTSDFKGLNRTGLYWDDNR